MEANLEELTSPGGLRLEPMVTGGNGRTTVGVRIYAKPVGWQLGQACSEEEHVLVRQVGR